MACKCGELTHPPARTTLTRCPTCRRVLVTPLLHLELGLPERCPVCDPEPKGGAS